MRRSRAYLRFGWLLTFLAVLTVTARSRAASQVRTRGVASDRTVRLPSSAGRLELLPLLAGREAPLFGSFVRPGAAGDSVEALPSEAACPPDMVEVEGDYCPLVRHKCLRWLDPATRLQCAEFDRASEPAACPVKTQHERFCIDRYEWPNERGATPTSMASWYEARATCEGIGKRLCTDTEWTLACEGPERQPYPYGDGYERDDRACNIDKPYVWPHADRLFDPRTSRGELARLDQREPSGARASCVSPYGAYDMAGNVDEWVVNVSHGGKPYQSGLKGGYWGPVRTRCRPMTTAHDESFRYYQIGFRCCDGARAVDFGDATVATL